MICKNSIQAQAAVEALAEFRNIGAAVLIVKTQYKPKRLLRLAGIVYKALIAMTVKTQYKPKRLLRPVPRYSAVCLCQTK